MQKKFSYPLKVEDLNQSDYRFVLNADAEELKDIAGILQVEKARFFKAEIFLKLLHRENILKVWGEVKAKLEIKSVISLENFQKNFKIPFELTFDTKATYKDIRERECGINDDVPDVIENGVINLADIALEQVALNLDDYPRAEGEVFSGYSTFDGEPEKENPFAVLAKLKK